MAAAARTSSTPASATTRSIISLPKSPSTVAGASIRSFSRPRQRSTSAMSTRRAVIPSRSRISRTSTPVRWPRAFPSQAPQRPIRFSVAQARMRLMAPAAPTSFLPAAATTPSPIAARKSPWMVAPASIPLSWRPRVGSPPSISLWPRAPTKPLATASARSISRTSTRARCRAHSSSPGLPLRTQSQPVPVQIRSTATAARTLSLPVAAMTRLTTGDRKLPSTEEPVPTRWFSRLARPSTSPPQISQPVTLRPSPASRTSMAPVSPRSRRRRSRDRRVPTRSPGAQAPIPSTAMVGLTS